MGLCGHQGALVQGFGREGSALLLRDSIWKAHPVSCCPSQLLRGAHRAIITEKEGEKSFNVYENLVFPLPFSCFLHPPSCLSLFNLPCLSRVLELCSFRSRSAFGQGLLLPLPVPMGRRRPKSAEWHVQGPKLLHAPSLPAMKVVLRGNFQSCEKQAFQYQNLVFPSLSVGKW